MVLVIRMPPLHRPCLLIFRSILVTLETRIHDYNFVKEPEDEPQSSAPSLESAPHINVFQTFHIKNPADGNNTNVYIKVYSQHVIGRCAGWLEVFHVFCSHGENRIGNTMAFFIDREVIRSRFMEEMFFATGVLRDIATYIFDRYGRLRAEHKRNKKHPDLYDWNDRLDSGAFLVIQSFYVIPGWRRKGLARAMVNMLVEKVREREKPATSVFVVPGVLPMRSDKCCLRFEVPGNAASPYKDYGQVTRRFLWLMGFRPIGSTPCLALPTGPAAPTAPQCLTDTDEVGFVLTPYGYKWVHLEASKIGEPFGEWKAQLAWFEQKKKELPILYATANLEDDELRDWFHEHANVCRPADWLEVDQARRNVLHLAAIWLKCKSLMWLLKNLDVNICCYLKEGTTRRGYTPLEELQFRLETVRITDGVLALSDKFRGFCEGADICLASLKCLELQPWGDPVKQPPSAFWADDFYGDDSITLNLKEIGLKFGLNIPWNEYKDGIDDGTTFNATETVEYQVNNTGRILKLRIDDLSTRDPFANGPGRIITGERLLFGCDCDMCLDGVISSRMRFVLLIQAFYLENSLQLVEQNGENEAFWRIMNIFWTEKASPEAAQSYRHSISRHHWDRKIYMAILKALQWDQLPTLHRIKCIFRGANAAYHHWLDSGRADKEIKTALRVLFEFAKDQDECVGTWRLGQSMEDYRDTLSRYVQTCRNDQEYGFVARQLGVDMEARFDEACFVKMRRRIIRDESKRAIEEGNYGTLVSCQGTIME
jgi:GNAT superfamily N-acetyltransferase